MRKKIIMDVSYWIGFMQYLNNNGYRISEPMLQRFLEALSLPDISVNRDSVGLLQTFFCMDQNEYKALPKLYEKYKIERPSHNAATSKEMEDDVQKLRKEFEQEVRDYED